MDGDLEFSLGGLEIDTITTGLEEGAEHDWGPVREAYERVYEELHMTRGPGMVCLSRTTEDLYEKVQVGGKLY